MTTRTRWQGWTIVDKNGRIVTDPPPYSEPFLWKRKADAEEVKEEGQRVVRCEVRLVK